MSFARGLALAAMAASALGNLGTRFADATEGLANLNLAAGEFAGMLGRRISHGRNHSRGHRGQFAKKVDRQRMRNQMRRATHKRQRGLPGRMQYA